MAIDYELYKVETKKSGGKTYISFSSEVEPETVSQISELKARGFDVKAATKDMVADMHKNLISKK
jgi:hypothetical protein